MLLNQDEIDDEENKEIRNRIYKAPEIANMVEYDATPAIDVYSFAIILVEISTRTDPFEVSVK